MTGGDLIGRVSYRFNLTELGRRRAQDAMKQCAYVGPAPVPLEDYVEQTYRQAVTGISVTPEPLRRRSPSGHQGGAVQRHRPGHRQRQVGVHLRSARQRQDLDCPRHRRLHEQRGGEIYVPYAFLAENSIITVYDQAVHQPAETMPTTASKTTRRPSAGCSTPAPSTRAGCKIRRPVIVTGGELNLDMLDLRYNAEPNFYQAPLHVKANGGVFLIDDFGRQLCSPKELLNRWILPLEDRHDFLTVASGKKFEVPFEQLIIFSTNLDPKDLVDDAFLRRIRHKVEIDAPARDVYEQIFNAVAKRLGMAPCPDAIDYLYERYYDRRAVRPRQRLPRSAGDCAVDLPIP